MRECFIKKDQIWLHTNGYLYVVLMVTNLDAGQDRQDEYPVTVVYTRYSEPDGKLWSKKLDGFLNSRVYVKTL